MKYPIGIQNFEKLRTEGCVYVDKTEFVYKLASTGWYYFLSRPRRFGKSLLLSTMKAYFEGKKELFEGLAIEKLEQEWAEYPVLYIDLNSEDYIGDPNSLSSTLHQQLTSFEKSYGADAGGATIPGRFRAVIQRAYEKTGRKVVILVDEYDKPLVETINNRELQEKYRTALKAFYSVLKTQDQYIRFAFLTGVSKFGKVSVFSDLNNLEDISMDARYATVCGISEKEMHTYFEESIQILAEATKKTYEETCAELKKQYDGYHFCEDCEGMYNPFSLLNTFKSEKFSKYWFSTGTPSMLAQLLKETNFSIDKLEGSTATADLLGSIETMHSNPIPIIYQTGYLTIKGYDAEFGKYKLGFPNKEVEYGFTNYLLRYFVPSKERSTEFDIDNFVNEVRSGEAEEFMERLKAMFASNSYEVAGNKEIYFHNVVQLTFKLMGFYVGVEQTTSDDRIDLVVNTRDYIYIIEFKLDGSAEEAMRQIEEKDYAAPYVRDGRTIIKIGVNFSSKTRNITDWKIERNA